MLSQASTYYRSSAYLLRAEQAFWQDLVCCGTKFGSLIDLTAHERGTHGSSSSKIEAVTDWKAWDAFLATVPNDAMEHTRERAEAGRDVPLATEDFHHQKPCGARAPLRVPIAVDESFAASYKADELSAQNGAKARELVFSSSADLHHDTQVPPRKGRQGALDNATKENQLKMKTMGACWRCKILKKPVRLLPHLEYQ